MSAEWAGQKVDSAIKELDVTWHWRPKLSTGVVTSKANVWSRAARRKKQFGSPTAATDSMNADKAGQETDSDEDEEPVALAVKITSKDGEVELRWLQGHDHISFESFCGMLKRALTNGD